MNEYLRPLVAFALALSLAACGPEPEPREDLAALKRDIQQATERMYWIHLRLDTAANEISDAEVAARQGNTSAAGFHAAEAYRSLEQADDALLELGQRMQAMAGLDQR